MSLPQPIDSSTDDADERCSFGEWDEALADEPCTSFIGGVPLASAALAFAELRSTTMRACGSSTTCAPRL
jgi:hypothetical protein